jgi:hypothetical protein
MVYQLKPDAVVLAKASFKLSARRGRDGLGVQREGWVGREGDGKGGRNTKKSKFGRGRRVSTAKNGQMERRGLEE